jgi:asparaginyl-tRNA synthetase
MSESKVFYICHITGNDETGDGTELKPLNSLLRAMQLAESTEADFRVSTLTGKEEEADGGPKEWEKPSKSAMKKAIGRFEQEKKKNERAREKTAKTMESNEKKLEEAKKIQLTQNQTLPEAKKVKIRDCPELCGRRVKICGFVHRIRQQRINYSIFCNLYL